MLFKKILKLISFFYMPAIVFVLSLFLEFVFHIYDVLPWIDIPFHFIGGASIAFSFVLILNYFKDEKILKMNVLVNIGVVFLLVALVAIFWECGEFLCDFYFNTTMINGLGDTFWDLCFGMFGGFFILLFSKV